jgi:hypothetical protein
MRRANRGFLTAIVLLSAGVASILLVASQDSVVTTAHLVRTRIDRQRASVMADSIAALVRLGQVAPGKATWSSNSYSATLEDRGADARATVTVRNTVVERTAPRK